MAEIFEIVEQNPKSSDTARIERLLAAGVRYGDWAYIREVLSWARVADLYSGASPDFRCLVDAFQEMLAAVAAFEAIYGSDSLFRYDLPEAQQFRTWQARSAELAEQHRTKPPSALVPVRPGTISP